MDHVEPRVLVLLAALLGGCDCGTARVDDSMSGTQGGAAEGSGTTMTASSASTSASASASSASTMPLFDVLPPNGSSSDDGTPPYPMECYEPEAFHDATEVQTPDGPLQIDEIWLGVDWCSREPYVALVQRPSVAGPGRELDILLLRPLGESGELFGTYEARVDWEVQGTIEVLEPAGPFIVAEPNGSAFHARIEAHDAGWDISVEVEVLDCGDAMCSCPCE